MCNLEPRLGLVEAVDIKLAGSNLEADESSPVPPRACTKYPENGGSVRGSPDYPAVPACMQLGGVQVLEGLSLVKTWLTIDRVLRCTATVGRSLIPTRSHSPIIVIESSLPTSSLVASKALGLRGYHQ